MKLKKVPMRTCALTKESLPKKELIRIVKFNDQVAVDISGKMNGRGTYLKKDKEVILESKKKKILSKALAINVPDEIYDELMAIIGE